MKLLIRIVYVGVILTLIGCAGNGSSGPDSRAFSAGGKIDYCKSGDKIVSSQAACLQDDAACYQLKNGKWCTGPRGATCPTGSNPLPKGTNCPSGSKCFEAAPGLNCAINLK